MNQWINESMNKQTNEKMNEINKHAGGISNEIGDVNSPMLQYNDTCMLLVAFHLFNNNQKKKKGHQSNKKKTCWEYVKRPSKLQFLNARVYFSQFNSHSYFDRKKLKFYLILNSLTTENSTNVSRSGAFVR